MTLSDLAWWIGVGVASAFGVLLIRTIILKAMSAYKLRRAGPRPLHASRHRLWRDPGPV